MSEQIHLRSEQISPTLHPQIMITESPQRDHETIARWLRVAAVGSDTIAILKQLVPEYSDAAIHHAADEALETATVAAPAAAPLPS